LTSLFSISFWDASIIAAAEKSGCRRLLSEDLNPGQIYGTILAVNPFAK
jgi:predicted nucleic acid-binding protein